MIAHAGPLALHTKGQCTQTSILLDGTILTKDFTQQNPVRLTEQFCWWTDEVSTPREGMFAIACQYRRGAGLLQPDVG